MRLITHERGGKGKEGGSDMAAVMCVSDVQSHDDQRERRKTHTDIWRKVGQSLTGRRSQRLVITKGVLIVHREDRTNLQRNKGTGYEKIQSVEFVVETHRPSYALISSSIFLRAGKRESLLSMMSKHHPHRQQQHGIASKVIYDVHTLLAPRLGKKEGRGERGSHRHHPWNCVPALEPQVHVPRVAQLLTFFVVPGGCLAQR